MGGTSRSALSSARSVDRRPGQFLVSRGRALTPSATASRAYLSAQTGRLYSMIVGMLTRAAVAVRMAVQAADRLGQRVRARHVGQPDGEPGGQAALRHPAPGLDVGWGAYARRMYGATSRAPSSASASEAGVASRHCSESTACESASMPDDAVTPRGQERVRSGSTSATRGQLRGSKRFIFFLRTVSVITADGLTSLPVPAVVGMAMRRQRVAAQRAEVLPVPRVPAVGQQQRDALGRVDRRSAADRDEQLLAAGGAGQVGAGQAVHVLRVGLHPVEDRDLDPAAGQRIRYRRRQARGAHAGVGDQQHRAAPRPAACSAAWPAMPRPNSTRGRHVELAVGGDAGRRAGPAPGAAAVAGGRRCPPGCRHPRRAISVIRS